MNKLFALTLATTASAVFLAQPVLSQENIVVMPSISEEAFVEKVSRDLDHQLRHAARNGDLNGEGITIVRFTRDASGEPTDLSVYRKSGKATLDRVALRAVGRLDSLSAVPGNVEGDQVYQANIIFASDWTGFRRLARQLEAEETARIAGSQDEARVFALGMTASRPRS